MNRSLVVFLVVLRLAIGWHFLVEGWLKVQSTYLVGPTATSKPFSSAAYFREAPGPLGQALRAYEGDPDDEALSRLVVRPASPDDDPANDRPQDRVPPGLHRDWQGLVDRHIAHYGLSDDRARQARDRLRQAEAAAVTWLSYLPPDDPSARLKDPRYAANTTEQTRTFATGEVKRRMSMAERVAEYRVKVAELRDATDSRLWAFGRDVEGPRLAALKREVAQLRAGLLSSLDEQTRKLKTDLDALLSADQKDLGPPPDPDARRVVEYVDLVTPWMLCAVGAGLLLGLFTRLWAAVGALFLLMTYLAVPSLPWLPAAGPSEGNYLFVNKNVIEMLALCALAAAPTGRWFGLDAVLSYLFGRRPAPAGAAAPRA